MVALVRGNRPENTAVDRHIALNDAHQLNKVSIGKVSKEDTLIRIFCTRSHQQLTATLNYYHQHYGQEFEQVGLSFIFSAWSFLTLSFYTSPTFFTNTCLFLNLCCWWALHAESQVCVCSPYCGRIREILNKRWDTVWCVSANQQNFMLRYLRTRMEALLFKLSPEWDFENLRELYGHLTACCVANLFLVKHLVVRMWVEAQYILWQLIYPNLHHSTSLGYLFGSWFGFEIFWLKWDDWFMTCRRQF